MSDDVKRVRRAKAVKGDPLGSLTENIWLDDLHGTHALLPWEVWEDYEGLQAEFIEMVNCADGQRVIIDRFRAELAEARAILTDADAWCSLVYHRKHEFNDPEVREHLIDVSRRARDWRRASDE